MRGALRRARGRHHILTEPVCCTVDLFSEDEKLPTLIGFIGRYDVNESVRLAVQRMLEILKTKKDAT